MNSANSMCRTFIIFDCTVFRQFIFAVGIFPGRVIPVTSKLTLQWLPCQASGDIGSGLGLVGPVSVSVSVSAQDVIVSQQFTPSPTPSPPPPPPKQCQYLIEHRSPSILEGGMSAVSFPHTSFLQAIDAVMLWSVHVQKVSQASEHLCPAKLQTRCDICCACQSICPFIPIDSGVPWTVDPQKSL